MSAAIIPAGADDRWPAGRPAAAGCAFDWRNWNLQCDWGALVLSSKLTKVQTERVARAREEGRDNSSISNLSKSADAQATANSCYWHGDVLKKRSPNQRSMVSIENAEVGRKSTEKRARLSKGRAI